jgi:hypothetical protein
MWEVEVDSWFEVKSGCKREIPCAALDVTAGFVSWIVRLVGMWLP